MLKSIDVLIGVSTIMLLTSMIVMAVTHFVMVLFQARGRNLKTGLVELLRQIDGRNDIDVNTGKKIVDAVLRSPQIKGIHDRLGSVVQREEFIHVLLELAAGTGMAKLDTDSQAKLNAMLKNNGIDDAKITMENIQALADQLARANPELAASVRRNIATVEKAGSKFVSGVHNWFDRTMDRVSERFTFYTRITAYIIALLVALTMQLDVVALVNHLSTDDTARIAIVDRATNAQHDLEDKLDRAQQANTAQSRTGTSGIALTAQQIDDEYAETEENVAGYAREITADTGMIVLPHSIQAWQLEFRWSMVPGIIMSAILMSLGAPFWYKALASLIQLRSLAAQNDDVQRAARSPGPVPGKEAATAT
jgi:hypothetical protein